MKETNIKFRLTKEEKKRFIDKCHLKGESMTEALMKMIRRYVK